jgi:hypothetical protein
MARYLQLTADLACLINNTDRGFFEGDVQTGIMLHAVLLLMLEAIHNGPRFTISLKRSTASADKRRPNTPSEGQAVVTFFEQRVRIQPGADKWDAG